MLYFFKGMDEPRSEPRDDGKTPKYDDPKKIHTVEEAQRIKYTVTDIHGNEIEVPGTMYSRPNVSYLGHTSDLFITPWIYEDRYTLNDPFFRRIPNLNQRERFYTIEERFYLSAEIARLAAIENPNRCVERRRKTDGWCQKHPMVGGLRCEWHTGMEHKATVAKKAAVIRQHKRASIIMKNKTKN